MVTRKDVAAALVIGIITFGIAASMYLAALALAVIAWR